MIDFELIVDEMLIAARAAILDGEHLELEPSQFSDCIIHIIEKLRQAEKDAARYKDYIESARFDIGNLSSKLERADSVISEVERVLSERQRNGDFSLDDLLSEAEYYINNHQGVK